MCIGHDQPSSELDLLLRCQDTQQCVFDLTLKPKLPTARHAHALPEHERLWNTDAVICAECTEEDLIVCTLDGVVEVHL
jgi:hypothetical protein